MRAACMPCTSVFMRTAEWARHGAGDVNDRHVFATTAGSGAGHRGSQNHRLCHARNWLTAFVLALATCLWLPAAQAAAPRIGVMTMQPGSVFFERFGHDALLVEDPDTGRAISYNFGAFDPAEPGFIGRFIRGEMEYQLYPLPLHVDLQMYRDEGRGVSVQWLDLSDAEAVAIEAALIENAKPQNARYRYDYFTDNCSTRVRDVLDRGLNGLLRSQLQTRSQGNTYRSEAVRLASPAPWMWMGFDVGLGPFADAPRSLWEDAFVPMRLADALESIRRPDGRPLVAGHEQLLPHRIAPEPVGRPQRWWSWLLTGLTGAAALCLLGRNAARRAAWFALPFWLLCSVLGMLMLFLWLFTAHRAGWANHNLALFNPLCMLLLPGAWRLLHGRPPGRLFAPMLIAIAIIAAVSLFTLWLPVYPQRNAPWLALLVPVHLALAWVLARPRARQ